MCIHGGAEMISAAITAEGAWEPNLCRTIQYYEKLAKQKAISLSSTGGRYWFADVGANIGFLSLCGYQVLPTVSIEAAPWNYAILSGTRNFWQNRWPDKPWYAVHQAVSTNPGQTIKLLGSVQNFGGSSLVNPNNHPLHESHGWGEGADIRYGHVVTETLDNIIDKHIPPGECIGVMKVDIEGYEYFAMQSFQENLRKRPPCNIFMEYHTILLKAASSSSRSDPSPLKLVEILKTTGYVPDQAIPTEASVDVELNLHWQLRNPTSEAQCDCSGLTDPRAS